MFLNNLYNAYYFIPYGVGNIPKNVPTATDNVSTPAIVAPIPPVKDKKSKK
jgi:hypothetical protein